jgi:hypothetical protein
VNHPLAFNDRALDDNSGGASMQRLYDALLFLAIPAYLFLNLFTLRGVPHHIVSDDGLFVLDGLRMTAGQWIYRDFFQFNAPGIDYVFFFAFKLFGARAWVPNLVTLLIGASLSWLSLHLSRRIMPRSWADLTIGIFVVFVYGRWLDATHHWFSLFLILLAIRVLLTDRSPSRIAVAGALIGVATFFTQTAGAAAWLAFAIALFVYERKSAASRHAMLQKQSSLFLSAALTWYLLSASTLWHVGWRTLWYFQVTFPQRYELRVDKNPIGVFLRAFPHAISFMQVQNLIFYLILISATPAALCVLFRKRRQNQKAPHADSMPIFLLAAVGLLLMAEAVTRPTQIRLYADVLPSLIVFFATLAWALSARPRLSRLLIATLWSATILSAVRQTMFNRATYSEITALPAGKIALQPQDAEELQFLVELTHPGELFFQAYAVQLYFPLGLSSPVYMDYLRMSPLTRPEFLRNAIQALEKNHVRYIILRPVTDSTTNPAGSHDLDPLYSWVESHYTRIHHFSNNEELWELRQ